EHAADPDPDDDREQQRVRLQLRVVGAERAEQHDPVDAEVEDAAPLAHGLAERREQERRRQPDARGNGGRQHGEREELVHSSSTSVAAGLRSGSGRPAGAGVARAWSAPGVDRARAAGDDPGRARTGDAASTFVSGPAASSRSRDRRRTYSMDTTNTTTSPFSATISAVGTGTAICSVLPPTSSPPNTNDDRIIHSGCSPPNSAATIPLNPAEPVNPVAVPSVTIRWEALPNTRIAPPSPHSAPESAMASVIVRLT